MTCANTGHRIRSHRHRAEIRKTRSNHDEVADSKITGTWDYKWPLGSVIRVAFQKPTKVTDFEAVREKVEALISTWGVVRGAGGKELQKRISIEFLKDTLAPPMGDAVPFLANRSPFRPEDPVKMPYDVLVSLEPLPIARYDMLEPTGPKAQPVQFPIADLGSYARRADYGEPTVYIGPFGKFAEMPPEEFYEQPLAQHVVVHEFGHVLGLAHLHQHPSLSDEDREKAFLPTKDMLPRITKLLGMTPDSQLLKAHLFEGWDGNLKFSDWPERPAALNEIKSVMTFPYISELLEGSHECDDLAKCAALQTAPTEADLAWLRSMYDPQYPA